MSARSFRLPLSRRMLELAWVQSFLAMLLAYLLKLFWLSFRLKREIHPDAAPFVTGEEQAIFCFWHGRMILLPFFIPKTRSMHVLISQHRDGELIAKLIRHFGIKSVRGSSSKGAKDATRNLIDALSQGGNIAITPDGPRGPAFEASRGALHLARLSGCAMIPVSFSASRFTRLKSWDRFIIPHPFARIRVEVGAPIRVAPRANLSELKAHKQTLQLALNAVRDAADEVHCA